MHDSRRSSPEVILTSDASGSWGCGAYWNTRWLQYHWSPDTADSNITIKELIPIVLAAAIWGYEWENKAIQCCCDNGAVVSIINSGTSKDPRVMGLMCCLHFISAKFNLLLSAIHLAGSDNAIPDAISRNNLPYFFLHFPQANSSPCPIPPALLDLLIHHKPDWTSPHWNKMFNTTFNQLCLPTPSAHTHQAPEGSLTSAPAQACNLNYPASESTLCQFAAHLGKQNLKHQTIKCYLAGIRFSQIMQTSHDPFIKDMPKLKYVLRGSESGTATPSTTPSNTIHSLANPQCFTPLPTRLLQHHAVGSLPALLFWLPTLRGITIPTMHAYDSSTHLSFADISTDGRLPPDIIQVKSKASKTDPFRQGVSVYIGRSKGSLCPVSALLSYLAIRGNKAGILFQFHDGTPLTKNRFVSKFCDLLRQAGINDTHYAGHSFRISTATTAAAKGIEDSLIQTLGRWKSSAYYLSYIRIPPSNLAALSQLLAS